MGGGGFLGLGPAPSAPAAPNYTAAAQATAAGNLEAARAAASANRINQITPYGSLTYTRNTAPTFNQTAYNAALQSYNQARENYRPQTDEYGNVVNPFDLTAPKYSDFMVTPSPDEGWVATQTLSPDQQRLLDIQNQLSYGLGQLGTKGLDYVAQQLQQPFDVSQLPSIGINPSETYSDAIMRRLAPTMQQQTEQLEQKLANQGIQVGTEAYDRAMRNQAQRQNDLLLGAQTQGLQAGLSARQQQLAELAYRRNEPLNILSALRSGSQVTAPSYVNSAQQATTAGPDLLGAAQMGYNAQMGDYNAQQAAQANLNQGLFSLGGAALMSDPRTKENIKAIGVMDNGLTLYSFEYKDKFKDHAFAGHGVHVGVMADEVEQVFPYAVKTLDDGYKVVDYGLIP